MMMIMPWHSEGTSKNSDIYRWCPKNLIAVYKGGL